MKRSRDFFFGMADIFHFQRPILRSLVCYYNRLHYHHISCSSVLPPSSHSARQLRTKRRVCIVLAFRGKHMSGEIQKSLFLFAGGFHMKQFFFLVRQQCVNCVPAFRTCRALKYCREMKSAAAVHKKKDAYTRRGTSEVVPPVVRRE